MDIIIDGYNLIYAWGWLKPADGSKSLEKSRQRLIRELAAKIPSENRSRVSIVFDAKAAPHDNVKSPVIISGFEVVFAYDYDEADALIEEMIRRHANPKSLTVVSSDNRLKTATQRRNAIAINSEDWLDELEIRFPLTRAEPETSVSAKDQAMQELSETDWLAEFQIDPSHPGSADNPEKNRPSPPKETYNPFPPGYGEDVVE